MTPVNHAGNGDSTDKRVIHDPKCDRCMASGKTCIGIIGRACTPCGTMKMKCSMASKIGRRPSLVNTAGVDRANRAAPTVQRGGSAPSTAPAPRASHVRASVHAHESGTISKMNGGPGHASASAGAKRVREEDSLDALVEEAAALSAGGSNKRARTDNKSRMHPTITAALNQISTEWRSETSRRDGRRESARAVSKGKDRASDQNLARVLDDSSILRLVTPLLQIQAAMAEMSSELVKILEKPKNVSGT